MRLLARLSLATMGFALVVPISARAADAPAPRSMSVAVAPHKHTGRLKLHPHLCEKCSAAKPAPVASNGMPFNMSDAKIVSCSHNKNAVCKECQAFLAMPGTMSVAGSDRVTTPTGVASTSGHAVATDEAPGFSVATAGEPEPVGVMRTNFTSNGAPAPADMQAPGRAVASQPSAGRAPYLPPTPESSPHILGHLFGFSEMHNDFQDWRASRGRQKREAHAAIPYGTDGSRVEELPASMVFGKGPR